MIEINDIEDFERNLKTLKRSSTLPKDLELAYLLNHCEEFKLLYNGPELEDMEWSYDVVTAQVWHESYSQSSHEKWLKLRAYKILPKFNDLPFALKYCWSFWYDILPTAYKQLADEVMDRIGLFKPMSPKTLITNIDNITVFAKKRRERWSKGWFYFVDLTSLTGFNNKTRLSDVTPKLLEWLEPKKKKGFGIIPNYIQLFKAKLYKSLFEHINSKSKINYVEKFNDWVSNENNWATKGASAGVKAHYTDGGLTPPLKAAITVTYNLVEMRELFFSTEKEIFKPNVKIEAGQKDRVIIAAGNSLYIKMAYVSSWLEKSLSGYKHSTLFMNNKDKIELVYRNKIELIKQANNIFLPLDAKAFDQNVTNDELVACFDVIEDLLKHFHPTDDLLMAIKLIKKQWQNLYILIDDQELKWSDGLPSGVRWTALLGTFVNIARFFVIADYLEEKLGKGIDRINFFAQGDDDDIVTKSYTHAFCLFKLYGLFNIPVNIKKNFIADNTTEFLRKFTVVTPKFATLGYLARGILKSTFMDPLNRDRDEKENRLEEWLSVWNILHSRLCDATNIERICLAEMSRVASRIPINYKSWLLTPRTLLGGGLFNKFGYGVALKAVFTNLKKEIEIDIGSIVDKRLVNTNNKFKIDITENIIEQKSVSLAPTGAFPFKNINYIAENVSWKLVDDDFPLVRYISYDVKQEYQKYYINDVIQKLIDRSDWQMLKTICNLESETKFDYYFNNLSRKQFIAWLKNDLPGSQPIVLDYSSEFVSIVYNKLSDGAKTYCLSKDMSWEKIQNIFVTLELRVKDIIDTMKSEFIYGA